MIDSLARTDSGFAGSRYHGMHRMAHHRGHAGYGMAGYGMAGGGLAGHRRRAHNAGISIDTPERKEEFMDAGIIALSTLGLGYWQGLKGGVQKDPLIGLTYDLWIGVVGHVLNIFGLTDGESVQRKVAAVANAGLASYFLNMGVNMGVKGRTPATTTTTVTATTTAPAAPAAPAAPGAGVGARWDHSRAFSYR